MDIWEALGNELPTRVQGLSDLCFWLLACVCCLIVAVISQYRQRRRADREKVEADQSWREYFDRERAASDQRLREANDQITAERDARAKDLQKAAERAERQAKANRQLVLALQRLRRGSE